GELLHHRAGGGRRHLLPARERRGGDARAVLPEQVDLAQLVLDRVRERVRRHSAERRRPGRRGAAGSLVTVAATVASVERPCGSASATARTRTTRSCSGR